MELRHLRYFVAVAATLNFRKAADKLHVSSPALSKQIKDLEDEMGVQLFRRDTTSVHLTSAGEVFREEVVRILAETERAVAMAQEAEQGIQEKLAVGNIGLLTADIMSAALSKFISDYPEVQIQPIDLGIHQQVAALEEGSINLAILPAHYLTRISTQAQSELLLKIPLFVAMSVSHRFSGLPHLEIDDLVNENFLAVRAEDSSTHADYIRSILKGRGGKSGRQVQVHQIQGIESLLALLACGQGLSIFAGKGSQLQREGIVLRPLCDLDQPFYIELHAVWLQDYSRDSVRNFIGIFRDFGK